MEAITLRLSGAGRRTHCPPAVGMVERGFTICEIRGPPAEIASDRDPGHLVTEPAAE